MIWNTALDAPAQTPAATDDPAVREIAKLFEAAFAEADAAQLGSLFLPQAELIDDEGIIHKGRQAVTDLFSQFFQMFPGARAELQSESVRFVAADLAIEDGYLTIVAADGERRAKNRYITLLVKRTGGWRIASARYYGPGEASTPRDNLQPLAWMVGEWVSEESEEVVTLSVRWSDSENFLLVQFQATGNGDVLMKSTQRIGWDPLARQVRSWSFDEDGGYGIGRWTNIENAWVIKSEAVLPDGQTGTATIVLEPESADRFRMRGLDRVVGSEPQPDFEATIVRKPPAPGQGEAADQ
jgi:uncharacterized protein (TIGR02246 family)